jgi:cation diffusion facilitator CzcD-associated flavoprotein CzcO
MILSILERKWENPSEGELSLLITKGLRVAVVGSAASGIQIIPHIANIAKECYVFQRTPNWIIPKENYEYSKFQKFLFQVF